MKGIELSRKYYDTYGRPMLEEFSDMLPHIAVGYVGSGSDRLGYDDDISHDHDFGPGFCFFLPGEDVIDSRAEFRLRRAYDKLPREFMGYVRPTVAPVGGDRNGPIRMADFFTTMVGDPSGELDIMRWVTIPDSYLAEATDGEVFFDGSGEFTRIRNGLMNMPDDARRKRLAGNVIVMAQAGQYNYARCLAHGEPEAAQLALGTFVESAAKTVFLLAGRYMPFYKWAFRAMRGLDGGEHAANALGALLSGDIYDKAICEKKRERVEAFCAGIAETLTARGYSSAAGTELERHAYSINDGIRNGEVRNLNIFS